MAAKDYSRRVCECGCGVEFRPSHGGGQRFHRLACASRWKAEHPVYVTRDCVDCGGEFTTHNSQKRERCGWQCPALRNQIAVLSTGGPSAIQACAGHQFGPDLACSCGRTWDEHRAIPIVCENAPQVQPQEIQHAS